MVFAAEYPVQLGIAYLLVVGYLLRTLFVAVRLPAAVGVILSGFIFSYFFQAEILFARDLLQQLAFFLVLLTAGLEITLQDLKPYMFVVACLPASMEILAIATFAKYVKGWALVEGLVMGTVLTAIGDGLVIPKMKEFWVKFRSHPLPRLVFCWAPLEASFCLTLFGILAGASAPADAPEVSMAMIVGANLLRIVATLSAGALIGYTSGYVIPKRQELTFRGHQVFSGSSVEAFLMVLSIALIAFGLGAEEKGRAAVPMPMCGGSLFQPELLVILTGTFFSAAASSHVKHEVEGILGGVWIFGQLILFSMLGSKTDPTILPRVGQVLPIMACGYCARFIGVSIAILTTVKQRGCDCPGCVQSRRDSARHDILFCFLSTIPRATIQGALGAVPMTQHFFQHLDAKHEAQEFIFTAARLYIICSSIVGMILLNTIGPHLLVATSEATCACQKGEGPKVIVEEHVDMYAADMDYAMNKEGAVRILSENYDVDQKLLVALLETTSRLRKSGNSWQPQENEVERLMALRNRRTANADMYQFEARPLMDPVHHASSYHALSANNGALQSHTASSPAPATYQPGIADHTEGIADHTYTSTSSSPRGLLHLPSFGPLSALANMLRRVSVPQLPGQSTSQPDMADRTSSSTSRRSLLNLPSFGRKRSEQPAAQG